MFYIMFSALFGGYALWKGGDAYGQYDYCIVSFLAYPHRGKKITAPSLPAERLFFRITKFNS